MSTIERRWLSVEEAAEYTGTDAEWILAHIKSGALKSVITANRKKPTGSGKYRRRIDKNKLDALMERLETTETPTPKEDTESETKPVRLPTAKRERTRDRIARILNS